MPGVGIISASHDWSESLFWVLFLLLFPSINESYSSSDAYLADGNGNVKLVASISKEKKRDIKIKIRE